MECTEIGERMPPGGGLERTPPGRGRGAAGRGRVSRLPCNRALGSHVVRSTISYGMLRTVKFVSRLFCGYDIRWVGDVPADPWADIHLIAILNHTSLYEPVFAGAAPDRVLKHIARHGVVPVAEKTANRLLVGRFFKLVAEDVVPITRERDHTWDAVLSRADRKDAVVIILPEGRMKRKGGLDRRGNPMTIRGGIADVIRAIPGGRMLIVYSLGLHHIQAPGELIPRPFRTVSARLETIDIEVYRSELLRRRGEEGFKGAVIEDLTRRRDLCCCPSRPDSRPQLRPAADSRRS